jgi:hypothetical protein
MSLLLFKRDETGLGHPSPEQISIGEIVINSVTGRLYTKLVDGSVIEFIGQKICFDPVPEIATYYENLLIANDVVSNFCCAGALLEFEVKKLKPEPTPYSFRLIELTNNSNPQEISIQDAQFSNYQETIPPVAPSTTPKIIPYRKAIVPVNMAISLNTTGISLFKFAVLSDLNRPPLIEKIITIRCQEAT